MKKINQKENENEILNKKLASRLYMSDMLLNIRKR